MTRRAVLHLGMNKTGSTTIQVALRAYDTPQITWLQAPGFTHTELVCLPFLDPPPQLGGLASPQEARTAFDAALGATQKSVLISSEYLSDFRQPAAIEALCSALGAHVDAIEAVVYLRAPTAYLASVFQQSLKLRLPEHALHKLWPMYRARIAPWDAVLGARNVHVRPFDPAAFPKGDLMLDFAAQARLDPSSLPARVKRANEGLSREAIALLYAYRRAHRRPATQAQKRRAEAQMVFALKSFGTGRFSFAPSLTAAVTRRFSQDIAWAEARQGRAFAQTTPKDTPLRAFKDLSVEATRLDTDFRTWLAEKHPDIPRAPTPGPVAALESLVAHFMR